MPSLPSRQYLTEQYVHYRKRYFCLDDGPCIPPVDEVRIEWSNRLTSSAGICYPERKIIRLSAHYYRVYPEDLENILLHEMIHLVVPNHGPEFYGWLRYIRSLGGQVSRYAKSMAAEQSMARWQYECTQCGYVVYRYRRVRRGGRGFVHSMCGGSLRERCLTT